MDISTAVLAVRLGKDFTFFYNTSATIDNVLIFITSIRITKDITVCTTYFNTQQPYTVEMSHCYGSQYASIGYAYCEHSHWLRGGQF